MQASFVILLRVFFFHTPLNLVSQVSASLTALVPTLAQRSHVWRLSQRAYEQGAGISCQIFDLCVAPLEGMAEASFPVSV